MSVAIRKRSELTQDEMRDILSRIKFHYYDGDLIRTIHEDGEVWVIFADVLKALGYSAKPSHMIKRLRDGEFELKDIGAKSSLVNCINKAGLYSFTLYSNNIRVLEFYRWAEKNLWGS